MKRVLTYVVIVFLHAQTASAQPVFQATGFCVAAPTPERVDDFVKFIENDLAPGGINTLVLRVDFNYAYKSRPELRGSDPLSQEDVKKLVAACQKNNIALIPQVNLLGHQSWAAKTNKLLEVYPEFDETPHVTMPEKYEWPNEDGLYCKSYCPLHPEVHNVVFDLVGEIVEVFEAKAFHAGMDEVFYIADAKCPRCKGMDPAALFVGEVNKISAFLEQKGARLWIWGDRLIDASTSGIGMWEASMNNTARAVDLIAKSVVICDWHYENAIPTPAYFAVKDLDVIACSWRKSEVAREQVAMMHDFKQNSPTEMQENFLGVMHTVWTSAGNFMDSYYDKGGESDQEKATVNTFKAMITAAKNLKN